MIRAAKRFSTAKLVTPSFMGGATGHAAESPSEVPSYVNRKNPTRGCGVWRWRWRAGVEMPNYRRAWVPGATWFFTVNLLERRDNDLLVRVAASRP